MLSLVVLFFIVFLLFYATIGSNARLIWVILFILLLLVLFRLL